MRKRSDGALVSRIDEFQVSVTSVELLFILVRASIWLAVLAWAVVMGGWLKGSSWRSTWLIWTAGLLAYLVHVATAFAGFYHWSHAIAFSETLRQTAELTGIDSGAGIWLNYLIGILWIIDVIRWRLSGKAWIVGRWHWLSASFHVFLAFMIFNGTVVFGNGPVRWFGVVIFLALATVWLRARLLPHPES